MNKVKNPADRQLLVNFYEYLARVLRQRDGLADLLREAITYVDGAATPENADQFNLKKEAEELLDELNDERVNRRGKK